MKEEEKNASLTNEKNNSDNKLMSLAILSKSNLFEDKLFCKLYNIHNAKTNLKVPSPEFVIHIESNQYAGWYV